MAFSLVTFAVIAAVGFYFYLGFERPSETLAPVMKAEPLSEVILITDGVLEKDWVMERLALPQGIALMAIDLDLAKLRLEREGQVRNAVITREFPGSLVVTLQERVPVVRIMVPLEPGRPSAMFVDREGVVYQGFNYDTRMVRRLPWLDGVRLKRRGDGFVPLEGLDQVSDLLLAAQAEAAHLAAAWQIISLAELPLLKIRTREVEAIVFEAGDYRRQLARLDYILDHFLSQGDGLDRVERIDLSIASQVAVDLDGSQPVVSYGASVADTGTMLRNRGNNFTRNLPNAQNRGL